MPWPVLIQFKRDHFIWELIFQISNLHFPIFQRKEIHIRNLFKNANTVLSPTSHSFQTATSLHQQSHPANSSTPFHVSIWNGPYGTLSLKFKGLFPWSLVTWPMLLHTRLLWFEITSHTSEGYLHTYNASLPVTCQCWALHWIIDTTTIDHRGSAASS